MCRTPPPTSAPSGSEKKVSDEKIPPLLQIWLRVGSFVPKLEVGGLDFGFTIASCLFLACVKVAVLQALEHIFGWPADAVETGACSLVPIFHSGNLVPALWACLRSQKFSPSARFDGTFFLNGTRFCRIPMLITFTYLV